MTILHMDTGREMRGGQWQALLLMQALARRGHRQRLLALARSPLLERAREAGFEAAPLRVGWHAALREAPPDVIHAHDAGAHTAVAVRRALGKISVPLVVARRVAFPVRRGPLSRWKYRRVTRYIAISRYVAGELIAAGVPEDRISVVFDGVPLPDLASAANHRAAFRRQWELPPEAFVIGTLTTPAEKPVAPLIEAAACIPNLHVFIAAEGAGKMPALPGVRFLAPPENVSSYLFGLDAFVHLSKAEGLGSAALLAMAHALPVAASRVGGLPEIVREGETGLLVDNSAGEVAAALQRLSADRAKAVEMGRRGRRFVEENASDDIMALRTEQAYREACSQKSHPAPGSSSASRSCLGSSSAAF